MSKKFDAEETVRVAYMPLSTREVTFVLTRGKDHTRDKAMFTGDGELVIMSPEEIEAYQKRLE